MLWGPGNYEIYRQKYGLNVDWYIDERMDPIKATIAACKYLSKLYNEFGSWELAAAAYNAGEGKVNRAIRKADSESFGIWRRPLFEIRNQELRSKNNGLGNLR